MISIGMMMVVVRVVMKVRVLRVMMAVMILMVVIEVVLSVSLAIGFSSKLALASPVLKQLKGNS